MNVEVSGKLGVNGDGIIALPAPDGASTVQFEGDVHVGGAIAMVGERLIEKTSKVIGERFFNCLGQLPTR
jgi:carbon monoxide dehydrogenase subunit G